MQTTISSKTPALNRVNISFNYFRPNARGPMETKTIVNSAAAGLPLRTTVHNVFVTHSRACGLGGGGKEGRQQIAFELRPQIMSR